MYGEQRNPEDQSTFVGDEFARLELALTTIATTLKDLKVRAKGTKDLTAKAREAVTIAAQPAVIVPEITLRAKIETALRTKSLDATELARAVAAPASKVQDEIRALRKEARIANVGVAEHPIWTWRVGDHTSLAELRQTIERLISERPMTTRELTDATGARFTRVGGAIVEVQRSGKKILNMAMVGSGRAGRWLLIEHARDARLQPKKPKVKGDDAAS